MVVHLAYTLGIQVEKNLEEIKDEEENRKVK